MFILLMLLSHDPDILDRLQVMLNSISLNYCYLIFFFCQVKPNKITLTWQNILCNLGLLSKILICNFLQLRLRYILSPDSSVGRAVDWRSSCHQFESGSGHLKICFFVKKFCLFFMKLKLNCSCRTISMLRNN